MLQSSTIEERILYWPSLDMRVRALAERLLQRLDSCDFCDFGHTFRTLLDETGAPMEVQQELMRHDIRTTMNVYGKAMDASKREAHGKSRAHLTAKVA